MKEEVGYSYDEISNLLQFNEQQSGHLMPNEIFEDLKKEVLKEKDSLKRIHIPFSYSYYYLISWLYRYGKYGDVPINTGILKELLMYRKTYKGINYIIKENGFLDEIGYTNSTNDFPVGLPSRDIDNSPLFTLMSDLNISERKYVYNRINKSFKAKYPIKHMHRYDDDYESGMLTGIFYQSENTHMIDFEVFMYCMSQEGLGVVGFYLYGFIKNKNQIFRDSYNASYLTLAEEVGLAYSTMARYMKVLREYNVVTGIRNQEYYVEGLPDEEREPNSYIANGFDAFYAKRLPISKMPVMSLEKYIEQKKGKKTI